jgi:hypothetical protein
MCAHQVRPYVHCVSTDDRNNEPTNSRANADDAHSPRYEIRVTGHLGSRWTSWFDGMNLAAEDDGTTVIRGPVVDQAALHGLLQTLRDLGITLLSLVPLPADEAAAPPDSPDRTHHHTHHHAPGATS